MYYICKMNSSNFLITLITAGVSMLLYNPIRSLYLSIKLVDIPNWRKLSPTSVPLGGGMILVLSFFIGSVLSKLIFPDLPELYTVMYVGIVVMFASGTIDDAYDMRAIAKFFIQFVLAVITIVSTDLLLIDLNGLFGIQVLPEFLAWPLTVIYFLVFINMFNLSDGIDGLALTLGLVGFTFLAGTMVISGNLNLLMVIQILMGSIVVLLVNNFKWDKMYLGDSGALTLGYISAVLILKSLTSTDYILPDINYINFAPIYAMTIFWYPLFDLVRVFTLRLYYRKSPFSPDRTHLHHLLVDRGYSHLFVTTLVAILSISLALTSFYLSKVFSLYLSQTVAVNLLFVLMVLICWLVAYLLFVGWPYNLLPSRKK